MGDSSNFFHLLPNRQDVEHTRNLAKYIPHPTSSYVRINMPMTILRPVVGPTNVLRTNPHDTYHFPNDVKSYLQSLETNPFHSLSDIKNKSFHKLHLPDGSIAFSIHSTTHDLFKTLQRDRHTTDETYLEHKKTPSSANHTQ